MSNKKTDRKNKTNLTVTWPSNDTYFGVSDLANLNKDFIAITLRVRLKNALDEGIVTQIGAVHGGKGRPKLAFAMTPVTEAAINSARSVGVVLNDKYETVNVLDVKAEAETSEHTEVESTSTTTKVIA
jgi:S1-C subfamily serine protease